MQIDTANLVWGIALGAGAVAWLFGLRAHRRAFGASVDQRTTGTVDLPVSPESTSKVLAHLLAQGGQLLQARVDRADQSRVEAAVTLPMAPGRGGVVSARARARLVCDLSPGLMGTTIRYELDSTELLRGLARWSRVLLLLGAVALAVVAFVMPEFVIPSDNPAIRGQVVQSVQVVHFLWPPFLIAYLGRRLRTLLATRVQDILTNLPHVLTSLADESR